MLRLASTVLCLFQPALGLIEEIVTPDMFKTSVFGAERTLDLPEDHFPSAKQLQDEESKSYEACEHGWFTSCVEDAQLHYRKWLPKGKPKAIVVHMHGIQAHSGNGCGYEDRKIGSALRAEAFNKAGYAVYAHDMYGHGFSEGTRWLVPGSWKNNLGDYCKFVNIVADEHDDNIPIFLMGESYGSCLTIHLARQFQDRPETGPKNFDSIIVTASAIDADLPPYPVRFVLRNLLAPVFPRWTPFFMPNPVSSDRIWKDPKVLAFNTDPKRTCTKISTSGDAFRLGTGANLLDAIIDVKYKAIPGMKVPFCLIHGTEDAACPISGAEYFYETADTPAADRELNKLEGAYHDLFADPASSEVVQTSLNWIKKRLEATK